MDSSMDLKSMTLEELTDCVMELGEKKFRAKQIYGWLHQKHRKKSGRDEKCSSQMY